MVKVKYLPLENLDPGAIKGGAKFGNRTSPISKKPEFHNGIDKAAKAGTPIFAVDDGQVIVSKMQGNGRGYGEYIVIRHKNGYCSLSAHQSKRIAKMGQNVKAGDIIGLIGTTGDSTGPHLHFAMCKDFSKTEKGFFDPQEVFIEFLKKDEEAKKMLERIKKVIEISNEDALLEQLTAQKKTSMWYVIDRLLTIISDKK